MDGQQKWRWAGIVSVASICGVILTVFIGLNIANPVNLYITIYHVCGGDKDAGGGARLQ